MAPVDIELTTRESTEDLFKRQDTREALSSLGGPASGSDDLRLLRPEGSTRARAASVARVSALRIGIGLLGAAWGFCVGVGLSYPFAQLGRPATLLRSQQVYGVLILVSVFTGSVAAVNRCGLLRPKRIASIERAAELGLSRLSQSAKPNARCAWLAWTLITLVPPLLAGACLGVPSPAQRRIIIAIQTLGSLLPYPSAGPAGVPAGYCAEFGVKSLMAAQHGTTAGQDVRRLALEEEHQDSRPSVPSWWLQWGVDEAAAAEALVREMTLEEVQRLLQGVGWEGFEVEAGWYAGNILGVPRLGLPGLHMQDAAQGYRTMFEAQVGTVTAWPSMLALAATWDASLAHKYGSEVAAEFRAKGATVILGPSVNVHRVARGGRNAEYLSGEEPTLGAVMGAAYVRGIQSRGVAAVVKHYVLNQQETMRESSDVRIDERTLWEVYYPPFVGAVEAGVASVMCSYNLVNGSHVCGSRDLLTRDLRHRMGFDGWVMSDWWAVHEPDAAANGVDQNMPGNDGYFNMDRLRWHMGGSEEGGGPTAIQHAATQHAATDDEAPHMTDPSKLPYGLLGRMALRVVRAALRVGAYDGVTCHVGCDCGPRMMSAVGTSASHHATARYIAAASVVMLKNEPPRRGMRAPLPLHRGLRVALLGSACDAKSAFEVPSRRSYWAAGDYYVVGGSGRVFFNSSASVRSGLEAAGIIVSYYDGDDVAQAAALMATADVAIACGGAITQESWDRPSLKLDQDEFLQSLVRATTARRAVGTLPPLVVTALAPGVITADWAETVDAAVIVFLGGEQTGNALADVLIGDINPSGRLPVTLPMSEDDMVAPCPHQRCEYTERLNVGWRALHHQPVRFPFGHGLSFTEFEYAWAQRPQLMNAANATITSDALNMSVVVTNTGLVAGAEVVQLYLQYPRDAGEPALVLRGFAKTRQLAPAQRATVLFTLSQRDISTWIPGIGWRIAHGDFGVMIGSSSRDERLSTDVSVD